MKLQKPPCGRSKDQRAAEGCGGRWGVQVQALTADFVFCVCSHIENWTGLQTLRDVDMELYTGLQKL